MRNSDSSGNIFFTLFGAVGLVGVIGASTMTIMKGPVKSMAEVTKRTVAENNMIAAGRLSIVAVKQQTNEDCDNDNFVEPLPWDTTGTGTAPAGGGFLPASVGASRQDPWGTTFGYCSWDHGTAIDNAGCGGASQRRLRGANVQDKAVIAVISAGPNRVFETACNDSSHATAPYVARTAGSDDMILEYTYADSEGMSGGLWNVKAGDLKTAEIDKNLEIKNQANAVVMAFDQTTDTSKPSLKVDFISKLTPAKKGVEYLSNIMLGSSWLSGDGDAEGISINSAGLVNASGGVSAGRDGFSGTYNSAQVQGVWSIGPTYKIDQANNTFGNLYGIGYGYQTSATGAANTPISGFGHQLLFAQNGAVNAAISLAGHGYFGGNVGIGTTSPAFKLHVVDGGTGGRGISATVAAANGIGVYGEATAANGTAAGVSGYSASTSGRGVQGYATATSGTTYGVFGQISSTSGTGVHGVATAASGSTYGVFGQSSSTSGKGVSGHAAATSGTTYGGLFTSSSPSGMGVQGAATASSGINYGGYFISNSPSGFGVYGRANNASGYGVYSQGRAHVEGNLSASGFINDTGSATAGLKFISGGYMTMNSPSSSYDIWLQGNTASTTGGDARNLALLGNTTNDTLYVNHGSEYTGGTIIGGPVSWGGAAAITAVNHLTTKAYVDARVAAGTGFVEQDPQVGTITDGKWCLASGGVVTCNAVPPAGDNLGNHLATANLDMANRAIVSDAGTIRDANGGWVRTYNSTGWYNGTYGGGWYMTDTNYLRNYNNKGVYATTTSLVAVTGDSDSGNGVQGLSGTNHGVYGQSGSSYGIRGRTLSATLGGVIGYAGNGTTYGILGHANAYSLYGNGQIYAAGNITSNADILATGNFAANAADAVGAPGYSWNGDTNTGMWRPGADIVGMTAGGQESIRFYPTYIHAMSNQIKNLAAPTAASDATTKTYVDTQVATALNQAEGDARYLRLTGGTLSGSLTATAYYHSSDRNLKTGIIGIADPFVLLNGINGKHYQWKDSGEPAYGVIAQDVEKVMPEAVRVNDKGYKTVEYDQLIAPLIEAVKQLKTANDNLRIEVRTLRADDSSVRESADLRGGETQ